MSDPDPNAPPAQDPNAQPAEPQPSAGTQPAAQPDIAGIIKSALDPLVQRIDGLESKFSQPQAPGVPAQPAAADPIDARITLRKQQIAAIRAGELDGRYEPEIQADLADAVAEKRGRAIAADESARYEQQNHRGAFVSAYNKNLEETYTEFPELKDANSELYKETVKILSQDPIHRRVQESLSVKDPRQASKIDFSSLDPRINQKAAREAFAIVQRRNSGRPLSQQPSPSLAKTGLERGGATPPAASDEDLARLESEAVQSGDRGAWARYIKARDQRLEARKVATA